MQRQHGAIPDQPSRIRDVLAHSCRNMDARRSSACESQRKLRKSGLTQVIDKGMSIAEQIGEHREKVSAATYDIGQVRLGHVHGGEDSTRIEAFRKPNMRRRCGGSRSSCGHHEEVPEYIAFLQDHGFEPRRGGRKA